VWDIFPLSLIAEDYSMNKIIQLSSLALLLTSTHIYAHHPAADIVDPEIYEMIDANVSDVHQDMTFDDMGGDTTDVGGVAQSRDDDVGNMGADMGGDVEDVGAAFSENMEDIGSAMEAREEMNSMADAEPSGPMSARR
jgi:hypothetical protein